MEQLYKSISLIGQKYAADKIVLFGSRARGDNNERSDIDLAIYGMPEDNRSLFWIELEELPTLLKFDIVHINGNTDSALVENIEKDGVVIYEKD